MAGGEPVARPDVLSLVTERAPVAPPARDAASAVLHARLNDEDLRALREHRAGDYGRLRAAATTDAERRRIDLIWTAHIPIEGALARTGLVADMPPAEVHAMASGPLAAGGDHYLADATLDALQSAGLDLEPGAMVLDFGCSSGRVTRVLGAVRPDVRWIGCDPNAQAIAWARDHLKMAEFFVSPVRPPLEIDTGSLDAAFAISVWSHFAQEPALAWLDEMHRVLRPGGLLLITTHGLTSVARNAPTGALGEEVARAAAESMVRGEHHFVDVWGAEGDWGVVDPQWGDSWCTAEWLATHATPRWAIRLFRPGGLDGNQDLVVLERAADPVRRPRPSSSAPARRPRLSATIRFHQHPERAARLVRLVAPHVDEVLVAADERVGPQDLAIVADAQPERILRMAAVRPPERGTPYLATQAPGDWTLRLDEDDVPTPRLLRALRGLTGTSDNVAYRLQRQWVWPDARHYLAQRPWWPDPQLRLTSTDPAAVGYAGSAPAVGRVLGPWHDVDLALLHLPLVTRDRATRETDLAGDEQAASLPAIEGLPFPQAYFVPEVRDPAPRVLALDPEDAAALAWVLDGTGPPPPEPRRLRRRRPATDVPVVDAAEIEAAIPTTEGPGPAPPPITPGVSFSPAVARVRLELADHDLRFFAGVSRAVVVALTNDGSVDLLDAPAPGVTVRSRWGHDAAPPAATGLSARVGPGTRRVLLAPAETPSVPGVHTLTLEVLDGKGAALGEPLRLTVTVL